jgi:hypothetical protein
MTEPVDLAALKGIVATVVTTGHVESRFAWDLANVRSWCDRNGYHNIEWREFPAVLVEPGRDRVLMHAIKEEYDWLIQIDADACSLPHELVPLLLDTAYNVVPDSAMVGAYCQLKNPPYMPTIDTGTGTWEEHYPGSGVLPVIRTGGHCFVLKTEALRGWEPPWFKTRPVPPPAQSLFEVDNLARCWNDGKNPLDGDAWNKLVEKAQEAAPKGPQHHVGEDSGFCDGLTARGGKIYVNTDIVAGHLTKKELRPIDLKREIQKQHDGRRLLCGILPQ